MFRLMRNTHLVLGLVFVFYGIVFAVSSLTIVYRPFLPNQKQTEERTVTLAAAAASPRELALELIRNHGLKGDLREIEETAEQIQFRIARPGTEAAVQYSRASGETKITTNRHGPLETLVQFHTTHGFWHDFLPANAWAVLSLLGSIGLLLLGASGIYLWFSFHNERVIGGVLLAVGLAYGVTLLVLARMA